MGLLLSRSTVIYLLYHVDVNLRILTEERKRWSSDSRMVHACSRGVPEYTALLCFLSGCVTIALGVLRLGFLVEFISTPVVSGFTSAASVIIACSQIKGLLGIKINGDRFVDIWMELYEKIHQSRMPDLILSCCCVIILLVLKVKIEFSCMDTNSELNDFNI